MENEIKVRPSKVTLKWDTHTALAAIVLGSLLALAILRGSLASGGAVQP